ncbi:MAG: LysM peptidoglycan-binding domain-containing protein [Firmicutes bacterium]|nr:LysM peptidoglycan-binding domain-containing protein [Bacillota bacterium]
MPRTRKLFLVTALGSLSLTIGTAWAQTYYVQPGDSLYKIAARYGTSVSTLQKNNGLKSTALYPGQALNVTSGSSTGSGWTYTVRSGDTLYLIAKRYGTSIDVLKRANNLSSNYLWVGQRLTISSGSTAKSSSTGYRVQSGDSLYLIARKYGTTVDALKKANGLSGSNLWVGQTLKIPAASGGAVTANSKFNLNQSDIDLLARLVRAESEGEPYTGQVAVAATILNRLKDSRYPNTVPGIIYQVDHGRYQYSPVLDGRINLPPTSSTYKAVQAALSGWDPSNGANGFYNPTGTSSSWVRSHPVTARIGNHVFFSY